MRWLPWTVIVVWAFSLGGPRPAAAGDKAAAFLTPDLAGWEGLIDEFWTYKDGVLTGAAPKGLKFNTFLCSKKKYGDFELTFQVKLSGANPNSGVQIRSEVFDKKHFAVKGPQCDMGQVYWGSLYGEHFGGMMKAADKDLVAKVLKKNDFNDYAIKCVGKHVTIKLNGHVTVDGAFAKMPDTGIIAWQLHSGGPMEVIFKKIHFRELPRAKEGAKNTTKKDFQLTSQEKEVLRLINDFRKKNDLPDLKINLLLCEVSRQHSQNLARLNKLTHVLDGKGPSDRARDAGYPTGVAENCAGGGRNKPASFFQLWVDSPPHRANLLGKEATEMGVGFAPTSDGRVHFYTAMFGLSGTIKRPSASGLKGSVMISSM